MKSTVLAVLALSCISTLGANFKVVYGDDNRVLVDDSTNENYVKWASATAAMIPSNKVRFPEPDDKYPDTVKFFGETLQSSQNLCSGEKFGSELTVANCSGFLVKKGDKQYLITAGHCISTQSECDSNVWAFGYTAKNVTKQKPYLDKNKVYKCKSVVNEGFSAYGDNDYAVLELDRVVKDIEPLKFRTEGKVDSNSELVVIGHPSGLPTMINDEGSVRENTNEFYFEANLDTFGGNSGSAVLDAETGLVEGILVRGESDYEHEYKEDGGYCYKVKECKEGECRGEDVTRITVIETLTGKAGPVIPERIETNPYDLYNSPYDDLDWAFMNPWNEPDFNPVFH